MINPNFVATLCSSFSSEKRHPLRPFAHHYRYSAENIFFVCCNFFPCHQCLPFTRKQNWNFSTWNFWNRGKTIVDPPFFRNTCHGLKNPRADSPNKKTPSTTLAIFFRKNRPRCREPNSVRKKVSFPSTFVGLEKTPQVPNSAPKGDRFRKLVVECTNPGRKLYKSMRKSTWMCFSFFPRDRGEHKNIDISGKSVVLTGEFEFREYVRRAFFFRFSVCCF